MKTRFTEILDRIKLHVVVFSISLLQPCKYLFFVFYNNNDVCKTSVLKGAAGSRIRADISLKYLL